MERDQLRHRAVRTETRFWELFGFPPGLAHEMAIDTIVGALALSWASQVIKNPLATGVTRELMLEIDRVTRIDDPSPYNPVIVL